MYDIFVRKRITQLRMKKNVSERKISLYLGHSASYINNIVSRNSLPSLSELFTICEYFGITPKEFFDEENSNPMKLQTVFNDLKLLDDDKIENIHRLIKDMLK